MDEKSASVTQTERQLKRLQEENAQLKQELSSLSSLYNQLVSEGKHEKFDERRVTFLKAQLIQLERQLIVLNEALSSRSAVLLEVENCLAAAADTLRQHNKTSGVPHITEVIENIESCRIKLYKNIENNTSEKLIQPIKMLDKFVKNRSHPPVTFMDICSGKIDHLNLKQVAKLESKLSQVYQHLFVMSKHLYNIVSSDNTSANSNVSKTVYSNLGGQVALTCKLLEDVTPDLLALSVLVPSAPWSILNRPYVADLTAETVLNSLPSFPKSKASHGKAMIEALMKGVNYSIHVKALETKILDQEMQLYRSIFQSQMDYTNSILSSLMSGYSSFEKETYELLCLPLKNIMDKYHNLSKKADEESLKQFLEAFKEQSSGISTAIQLFTPKGSSQMALSEYGAKFQESLDKIQRTCQEKRDRLIDELDSVKMSQEKAIEDLSLMFKEQHKNQQSTFDGKSEMDHIMKTMNATQLTDAPASSDVLTYAETPIDNARERRAVTMKAMQGISCNCGAEAETMKPNLPSLRDTPSRMPTLKRPTSLPRINGKGRTTPTAADQDSRSAPQSPALSSTDCTPNSLTPTGRIQATPKSETVSQNRRKSSLPSPSASPVYRTPKGVSMKKLVLVPKMPKQSNANSDQS